MTREMRMAYAETLVELGEENPKIVVLDADVGHSTKSVLFKERFPERYFNVGIAELNMASMAAGMAATGLIPFVNTYAVFLSLRSADAVHNLIAQDKLNVKLIGSYSGYSIGLEGSSHQSINDISLLRSMPNMTVITASDNTLTEKAVRAIAEYNGPVYLRLSKSALPDIYPKDLDFKIGKPIQITEGKDVTIFAMGSMVHRSLDAAEILKNKGLSATVVDVHTLKPIDEKAIVELAKHTGAVVTAEEHSIMGGLGSVITEVLSTNYPLPVEMLGIKDIFGQSGKHMDLLEYYGLNAENIAFKAEKVISRK